MLQLVTASSARPSAGETGCPTTTHCGRHLMGARDESGGQPDSGAKRRASEHTCTQGQRAFCGAGWHPAAEWHSAFPVPQRGQPAHRPTPQRGGLPTSMSSCPTKSRRFHFHAAHPHLIPRAKSGTRASRADHGVRPTIYAESSFLITMCFSRLGQAKACPTRAALTYCPRLAPS
jgi:hypothetical protein